MKPGALVGLACSGFHAKRCLQGALVRLNFSICAELEGAPYELLIEALKLLESQGKAQCVPSAPYKHALPNSSASMLLC